MQLTDLHFKSYKQKKYLPKTPGPNCNLLAFQQLRERFYSQDINYIKIFIIKYLSKY